MFVFCFFLLTFSAKKAEEKPKAQNTAEVAELLAEVKDLRAQVKNLTKIAKFKALSSQVAVLKQEVAEIQEMIAQARSLDSNGWKDWFTILGVCKPPKFWGRYENSVPRPSRRNKYQTETFFPTYPPFYDPYYPFYPGFPYLNAKNPHSRK